MPIPCWRNHLHWIVRGVAASRLRLHPADETESKVPRLEKKPRSHWRRQLLIVLFVGVGVGLLVKLHFVSTRYYQAWGHIAIRDIGQTDRQSVMDYHLASIQNFDNKELRELIHQGYASVFVSDDQTISIRASNPQLHKAKELAGDFARAYAASAIEKQTLANQQMTGDQAKMIAIYRKLQDKRDALKKQVEQIGENLPKDDIDQYLGKVADEMESRISLSDELVNRMKRINADIDHFRREMVHPTITLDEQRLERMKYADRRYSGDYHLLAGKHGAYLSNLQVDMNGLETSLDELRNHLRAVSAITTKQLEFKLPPELSDDLLEMNLAVEKYEGQIARFRERWVRYRAKLIEMIGAPTRADFDGFLTLMSQLRQDLQQRCGTMPSHLEGLYRQLREGQRSQSGLSSLTARNVACSAVAGEIENGLEAWRKVRLHLNRLFPEGNVNLLTLGRVCRSVQWRLNLREKQLRQELEEQQMAAKKREAQVKVDALQKEFEAASEQLVAEFGRFSQNQQAMVRIGRDWPKLEKMRQAMGLIEQEMASIEGELNRDPAKRIGQEKIEVLPVTVRACNYAGIGPMAETGWAILLGLAAMVTTAGICSFLKKR